MEKDTSLKPFYTGWAMEAYPEMSEEDMAHHVGRQIELGANFVWIGHNNPGEVDVRKIEPGLSFAVWEAFRDENDPRHTNAVKIVRAQKRLLDFCLMCEIPVVLPIGYQIQMGEVWNDNHPDCLRRLPDGKIINWGGISACFYAPQYQTDIMNYYKWIVKSFVKPYRSILLMVNLSDEPFGGDYSQYAENTFRERTGYGFKEALQRGDQGLVELGKFQSNYIVEYARWSAEAWHSVCPDIPSTMSFCGHHGREENTMPGIPALFRDTPDYFHPTFDVYPRDGNQATPISESDVIMLTLFLRQIGYLSRKYRKPYWLWTTGNSWGLGQASEDKANITDAVLNQLMAMIGALENEAPLRGIAVWNYNVKRQGLYNDTIKPVYDVDVMFQKLTRTIARLRYFAGKKLLRHPQVAIVADRNHARRFIAKSQKCTWVKPFAFDKFFYPAKNNISVIIDESLSEILSYCEEHDMPPPPALIYLSSGDIELEPGEKDILLDYLYSGPRALVPQKLWMRLEGKETIMAEVSLYQSEPMDISEDEITAFLKDKQNHKDNLFHFTLDDLEIAYNLTKKEQKLSVSFRHSGKSLYLLDPFAKVKNEAALKDAKNNGLVLNHHEAAFVSPSQSPNLKAFLEALSLE